MTTDEKREWLARLNESRKNLRTLELEYKQKKDEALRISCVFGGNDKGKNDSKKNTVEKKYLDCAQIEEEYEQAHAEYEKIENEIKSEIMKLKKNDAKGIMRMHYIMGLDKKSIARLTNYSISNVKKIIKCSIDELAEEK